MKSLLFVLALIISLSAFSQAPQCLGKAASTGSRCKNKTKNFNGYCYVHQAQVGGQTTQPKKTNSSSYGSSSPTPTNQQQLSVADEIRKLKALLDEGIITQQEFDNQKKKLLAK